LRHLALPLILLVVSLAVAGCGDDEAKPAAQPAKTPEVSKALVGSYSMRLARAHRGADAPVELTDGSARWTLEIATTGGPDGGPAFTLANAANGPLESSSFETSGERLQLHMEECAGSEAVESEYRWKLGGGRLTFTTVKAGCPDTVAETLLTAGPWVRRG